MRLRASLICGVEQETVSGELKISRGAQESFETFGGPRSALIIRLAHQIQFHGVTHLQCTPSMAAMMAEDPKTLEALRSLKKLLLGGEAFVGTARRATGVSG